MRLFLSSDKFGNRLDLLVQLAGQGARVGVISNALDLIPQPNRDTYARLVHDPVAELNAAGLAATPLDLRDYFGAPQKLEPVLAALDMVWVTGGNAFLLRRAMRQSGFDRLAPPLIQADKLAYGGWSAGAVVACPNLKGIELMDDPNQVAPGYDTAPIFDGLDLIPFHIVPHYDSGHAESPAAEKVTMYLLDQGMPYRTMRDGDVIIRDADGIKAYEV
jgi:dipeptidase E